MSKIKAFPVHEGSMPFDALEILQIVAKSPKKINLAKSQIDFVNDVANVISIFSGYSVKNFLMRSRYLVVVRPRHLMAYFLFSRTTLSQEVIGAFIGGRDHASMINSIQAHHGILLSMIESKDGPYLDMLLMLRRKFHHIPIVMRSEDLMKLIDLENEKCLPIEKNLPLYEEQVKRKEIEKHLVQFCRINNIRSKHDAIKDYVKGM